MTRVKIADSEATQKAIQNFDSLPDSTHVRLPVVQAVLGNISAVTVWRWAKTGRIPQPIRPSCRVVMWNVGELRKATAALHGGAAT